jgi:hypothetical protein
LLLLLLLCLRRLLLLCLLLRLGFARRCTANQRRQGDAGPGRCCGAGCCWLRPCW